MSRNSSEELFNFIPVTCTQVERIVSSMPSNKSPGKPACASSKTAFLLSLALWQTSWTVLSQLLHFQTPGKRLRSYHYWKTEITRTHQIIASFRCLPLLQRSARRWHSNSSAIIYDVTASLVNIKVVIVNTTLQRLLILWSATSY